jgi:hypothetical protein
VSQPCAHAASFAPLKVMDSLAVAPQLASRAFLVIVSGTRGADAVTKHGDCALKSDKSPPTLNDYVPVHDACLSPQRRARSTEKQAAHPVNRGIEAQHG